MTSLTKYTIKEFDLQDILKHSPVFLIVQYNDLSSSEWRIQRQNLKELHCSAKVVQNKVTGKLLEQTRFENLKYALQGPSCIIYNVKDHEDAFDLNALYKYLVKQDKFTLIGGCIDHTLVSRLDVKSMTQLPSKKELLAQALVQMAGTTRRFVSLLDQQQGALNQVLQRSLEKPVTTLEGLKTVK